MVQEAGILLRVQQLQQCARRVALVACTAIGILACRLIHTLNPTTCVYCILHLLLQSWEEMHPISIAHASWLLLQAPTSQAD